MERLRRLEKDYDPHDVCREAADEIDRLRKQVDQAYQGNVGEELCACPTCGRTHWQMPFTTPAA